MVSFLLPLINDELVDKEKSYSGDKVADNGI